jgi:hypothetical protein
MSIKKCGAWKQWESIVAICHAFALEPTEETSATEVTAPGARRQRKSSEKENKSSEFRDKVGAVVASQLIHRGRIHMFRVISTTCSRLTLLRGLAEVSGEEANDCVQYFPPPISVERAANKMIKCLVFELCWQPDGRQYFVKSADCPVVKGEGEDIESALCDFVNAVECVVKDGWGGLYSKMSSETFHTKFCEGLIKGWQEDKVEVKSATYRTIAIFK